MIEQRNSHFGLVLSFVLAFLVGCGEPPSPPAPGDRPVEKLVDDENSEKNSENQPPAKNGAGGQIIDPNAPDPDTTDEPNVPNPNDEAGPEASPADSPEGVDLESATTLALIEKLGDLKTRTAVAAELASRVEEALPLLQEELKSDDSDRQVAAAFALGSFGSASLPAKEQLTELAKQTGPVGVVAKFSLDAIAEDAKSQPTE